jgi:1-deoxy-D-xylulose 5-phosphate reductoisomerase
LEFIQINKNNFPPIKLIPILNKYHSLPIILNATNEILVDQFLSKKIAFNAIMKNLFLILRDKNFKKYAIKNTNSIKEIISIDNWARNTIKQILTK